MRSMWCSRSNASIASPSAGSGMWDASIPRARARASAPAAARSDATSTTSPPRRDPRASRYATTAPRFDPPPDARTAMRDVCVGAISATTGPWRSREMTAIAERREDARGRVGERWRDLRLACSALPFVRRRLFGRDENAAPSEGSSGRDIPPHVTDEERCRTVQPVIGDRLLIEQDAGLAASAGLIDRRGMRTHVGRVDPRTFCGEQVGETLRNPIVLLALEVTTADGRLVGHHDDRNAGFVEPGQRPRGAGEQLDAGRVAEVVAVGDDRSVSIEEHRRDPRP